VGVAGASEFDVTSRKGETWVVWNWSIPSGYIDSGYYITLRVDGVVQNNISLITGLNIPYNYYLTDVNANEEHTIRIDIFNESGLITSEVSSVRTRSSDVFYYVIFILGLQLLVISLFKRNKIIPIVFGSFSLLIMLFISYVFIGYNSSFSNIGIICSVLSGFIIIYSLYELYKDHMNWGSDF
jgi:hypothetical protein